MRRAGLAGFLVPRADAFQGENVAACDERLAWLTGFAGSAGLCAALLQKAGVFIDGRYRLAVRGQVDLAVYEPVPVPEVKLADWLIASLPGGGDIGFDPWLHSKDEIAKLAAAIDRRGIRLRRCDNLVDRIWKNRPGPPVGIISIQTIEYAGESHREKRERLASQLRAEGRKSAIICAPESIAWLLNIRGSDVANVPVAHGLAILHDDAALALFVAPAKLNEMVRTHLGNDVQIAAPEDFAAFIDRLSGPVGLDIAATPVWISDRLDAAGIQISESDDPCKLPKARKNSAELAGARAAHLRDGVAMANFLCWFDGEAAKGRLTEIDVVKRLESFRAQTGALRDLAFNTICGSAANGAIVHYRVTNDSNRAIKAGDVVLVDSGAQYQDGTTDITRTLAVGAVDPDAVRAFTLVLKGMIAISRARWPVGLSGRDLDSFARSALWQAGLDYDHGTGHGVGSYLGVHEGPQGISRRTAAVLDSGMIVSNEPGYYREAAFGIRIENLVVVEAASIPPGGDRPMHSFETLTLAPIDRLMIDPALLDRRELDWLNAYHARVLRALSPLVPDPTSAWLQRACAPF